jgi:hypothetical protein
LNDNDGTSCGLGNCIHKEQIKFRQIQTRAIASFVRKRSDKANAHISVLAILYGNEKLFFKKGKTQKPSMPKGSNDLCDTVQFEETWESPSKADTYDGEEITNPDPPPATSASDP